MTSKKRALFIVHNYNSFQKDQIESVAHWFEVVYVLVRYNPLFRLFYYLTLTKFGRFNPSYTVDLHGKPPNIIVILTPVWYIPIDFFYNRLSGWHLESVIRAINKYNIKFDIIHAHFLWSAGNVGSKLKELYKVPFVVTGHGYDVYTLPFKNKFWRDKITGAVKSADAITTPSKSNLNQLHDIGLSDRVSVIPNGYNKHLFYQKDKTDCRTLLKLPQHKHIIISVGNIEYVKGHNYLVEAMKIMEQGVDVLCFIIGSGSQTASLRQQIKALNLEKKVILLGAIKHEQIVNWMNAADLLVVPSVKESFGVVQVEALACGLPVIATKNGGSEEIITEPSHGLLCEVKNSALLAQTIKDGLNRKWIQEDIMRYSLNFSWEILGRKFINIYQNLLQQ